MPKSKFVKASIAVLAASTVTAVNPAQAASSTKAEQAVKTAEFYSNSLSTFYKVDESGDLLLSPSFLKSYNNSKEAIAAAKKEVSKLSSPRIKRLMNDRLEFSEIQRLRAAYIIDAVKYGEKLDSARYKVKANFLVMSPSELRKAYDDLRKHTMQFEKMVSKVYGPKSREVVNTRFVLPAKLTTESFSYEMTRYDYHQKAKAALSAKDQATADKMFAIISMLETKGADLRAELTKLYPDNQLLKEFYSLIDASLEPTLMKEKMDLRTQYKVLFPTNFELSVLHTNDTHANLDRAPRLATSIKETRAIKKNSVLLNAGDVFSGTLYFNEFKGQADLELMNLLDYDAMTFGNHEFDLGTSVLSDFVKKAKFPFVSANVDFSKDANMKAYAGSDVSAEPKDGQSYSAIVKNIDGERVGIFGLTTAETSTISSPGKEVVFKDYIAEAKEAVKQLEAQGINKIVALTHIGYQDGGGDNDVTLAKEVEGIDVIVGGHSHTMLSAPVMDNTGAEPTVIVQTGELSKNLGVLDVEFDTKGKVIKQAGKLIDIDQKSGDQFVIKEDEEAASVLNTKYRPAIDKVKNEVVAKSEVALNGVRADVRTKETNLGNLIADGMLARAKSINPKTVIAVQNGGGIRESIDAGDVTMGEILTVLPFGNSLAIMNLKGDEIKAALEHSVELAPKEAGAFLHVAGMKFTFDSTKPAGQRVVKVEVKEDGTNYTDLDPAKSYSVATNAFTAAGGDNYTMFKKAYDEGRVSEPGFTDWETFSQYLRANPGIKPAVEGRITDQSAGK
ncbi:5'-nucleotidase C-terminal domain-containing protein [Bacillus sp. SJS]|uniref:5'-nucleotidase C-terminal domain-containing protein n=1 Tax=Bacillus sp. SJS TaxID=1423321 RepID=UPI000690AC3A|nr:5'-nucleotidase C-terminal domain-containing protein [Bacillus sp. SJS]KZZ85035.1 hypothetical protein AS29_008280 [Bacillus sp. SJS]